MLKEYYVVSRYIASIPRGQDMTEFILSQVESDLSIIKPENWKNYLNNTFSVIEGEEIDEEWDED